MMVSKIIIRRIVICLTLTLDYWSKSIIT